jgi:hypothetical protein
MHINTCLILKVTEMELSKYTDTKWSCLNIQIQKHCDCNKEKKLLIVNFILILIYSLNVKFIPNKYQNKCPKISPSNSMHFAIRVQKSRVAWSELLFAFFCVHSRIQNEIIFTKITNKMQRCRIIYYSLTALHVSSDILAHHQEHLNCDYSFWFYSRVSLLAAAASRHTWIKPEAVITVKMLLMMSENIARNM